ncbi:hypothetical protein VTK56DRAFT_3478 [Thermocarpiscus australiensis]
MDTSPTKRRVLGALDPNTLSPRVRQDPKQPTQNPMKANATGPVRTAAVPGRASSTHASSRIPEPDSRKRTLDAASDPTMAPRAGAADEPAPKRPCLDSGAKDGITQPTEHDTESPASTTRHRSASPGASSVFEDTSAIDTSQDTTLTEPDAETTAAPPPRPRASRPRLTREQAREKAEILRLRLGLASYKVRTGQTDVPLERLQMMRPVPGLTTTSLSPSSSVLGLHHPAGAGRSLSFSHAQGEGQGQGQGQGLGRTRQHPTAASFPPASSSSSGPKRKPLPGAPVRKGSNAGPGDGDALAAAGRAAPLPVAQPARRVAADRRLAVDEPGEEGARRQQQQQQQGQERKQKEEVRGKGEGGEAPRHGKCRLADDDGDDDDGTGRPRLLSREPTTAGGCGGGAPSRQSSRLLEDGDGQDEDLSSDGSHGGAASGLLSLARS